MDRRGFIKLIGMSLVAPLVLPGKTSLRPGTVHIPEKTIPAGTLMCYTDSTCTTLRPADSRLGDTVRNIVCVTSPSGPVTRGRVLVRVG